MPLALFSAALDASRYGMVTAMDSPAAHGLELVQLDSLDQSSKVCVNVSVELSV